MFKRKIRAFILGVIIITSLGAAYFLRQQYVVPILMYHSVDPQAEKKNMLAVTPEIFTRQMDFLKKHRYNIIPLEKLVDLIREKAKIPPKTVVITLDDGYRNNYLYAFPVLKKYNLPATIFVIINEIDRPQHDRLNWEEIKEMQDSGIVYFGSHTLGAEPLVNLQSEQEIRRQIVESKKILEEKLGRKVLVFSYPEGLFNAKIKQMVIDAGYAGAVATNPGRSSSDKDIFALKRLRISRNAANLFVFAVETSGYYTFFKENKKHRYEKK
ncbi:MAG: polysaccharide deacetylase family protein [Candidatus Omnitrophica bacterium]|nr:polysaccharide deacetylase family protein [Candidatus Omnitrophota bacterium]